MGKVACSLPSHRASPEKRFRVPHGCAILLGFSKQLAPVISRRPFIQTSEEHSQLHPTADSQRTPPLIGKRPKEGSGHGLGLYRITFTLPPP